MNPLTDIVDKLLGDVGRVSGREFRLVPHEAASGVSSLPSELDGATLMSDQPWCVPTADGGELCGVTVNRADGPHLLLSTPRPPQPAPPSSQQDLLNVLASTRELIEANEASTGETRQVTSELNQAYEELYLFSRIATQIRSLRFSPDMFRDLLQETLEAMRADVAAALFNNPIHRPVIVSGGACPSPDAALTPLLEQLVEAMPQSAPAFEGESYILGNSSEIPLFAAMHAQPFRALAIGIRNANQEYGWLLLISFDMGEIFRRGEFRLLSTLADQVGLVMANTDLYRDLEHFVINLVRSLVMAIEAKDDYTKGHSERVSTLSMKMADALHLDPEQCSNLQWASILHDLGKIGTTDNILNKVGKLTDAEFAAIKNHPTKGEEILKPIKQLEQALPAIRHHHERFDGSGYPDRLAGEEIPLLARIISVADTYDAITSERAYRAARSHEKAIAIIKDCAGTQLDPHVVEVFLSLVETTTGVDTSALQTERRETAA